MGHCQALFLSRGRENMATKLDSRSKAVEIDVKTVDEKQKTTETIKSPPGDRAKSSPKKADIDMKSKLNNQEIIVQFHDAVREGDLKLVEYIISRRLDVNQRGQFGDTALHWAVMGGTSQHDKIVKKLVSEGADANIVGAKAFTDNHTPLHIAASRGSEMCMKALLQSKGVDINVLTTNKETPLHKAAM